MCISCFEVVQELKDHQCSTLSKSNATKSKAAGIVVTAETLQQAQLATGISNNQLVTFTKHLRQDVAIEPYLKKQLGDRNKMFSDLFECTEEPEPMVYCNNIEALICRVLETRSAKEDDIILRLSVDEGRSFLKLSASFVVKNEERESGPFKSTGVKRIVVLAMTAAKESYEAIEAMLEKVKLDNLPGNLEVVFAQDLKCNNLMLGIGAHKSTFPCLFCHWEMTSQENRTFGSLRTDARGFQEAGGKKAKAKLFHSVSRTPLIGRSMPDSVLVSKVCCIPFLHCLLGITNKTYDEMVKLFPEVRQWPEQLHLHQDQYHGAVFEGNECKKLLTRLDLVQDILEKSGNLERDSPFIRVLKAFSTINHQFHSASVDQPVLSEAVLDFETAWKESKMSLTTKAHIIISHLVPFVTDSVNSMSILSEQSHEALHAEFAKTWAKYGVKKASNPRFGSQMLKAVLDFNSTHGV